MSVLLLSNITAQLARVG